MSIELAVIRAQRTRLLVTRKAGAGSSLPATCGGCASAPFELERYFARHEFAAPYLLGSSDGEALSLAELLELADEGGRRLWEDLSLGYTEPAGGAVPARGDRRAVGRRRVR